MLRTHLDGDLPDVDLVALARQAPGRAGAEAAQFVRDARAAARQAERDLSYKDLVDQVLPPETRPRRLLKQIAMHEAAHGVVGDLLGVQRLESLTLGAPGRDGVARFVTDLSSPATRAALEAMVMTGLAGRAMDELAGDANAMAAGGPGQINNATALLAALHRETGLGDSLLALGDAAEAASHLANDAKLRATVEADLKRLYAQAQEMVAEHRRDIEKIGVVADAPAVPDPATRCARG